MSDTVIGIHTGIGKTVCSAILGPVFVGETNPASEEYINKYAQLPVLFNLPVFNHINPQQIASFAETIKAAF